MPRPCCCHRFSLRRESAVASSSSPAPASPSGQITKNTNKIPDSFSLLPLFFTQVSVSFHSIARQSIVRPSGYTACIALSPFLPSADRHTGLPFPRTIIPTIPAPGSHVDSLHAFSPPANHWLGERERVRATCEMSERGIFSQRAFLFLTPATKQQPHEPRLVRHISW